MGNAVLEMASAKRALGLEGRGGGGWEGQKAVNGEDCSQRCRE
jgi:hypothetical protein